MTDPWITQRAVRAVMQSAGSAKYHRGAVLVTSLRSAEAFGLTQTEALHLAGVSIDRRRAGREEVDA